MNIFLAGATGAIGRLLLPLLVQAGHTVVGTTRSINRQAQIVAAGGRPMVVDAFDRDNVFAAVEAARPDVVIHQLTDLGSRDFASNSRLREEGTRHLVDAALSVGVQRMIAQSIAWVSVPGDGPANEDEPLDLAAAPPRGRTIEAVQALEDAVAQMPVGVVLRYGILYGPGTWYARDGLTTEQIRRGEVMANDAVTSFVHVADAAQAAVDALNWPAGVYQIVDDAPARASEWVPVYASLVGATPPSISAGAAAWERGAFNAKARRQGWRPRYASWREGFQSVLA